MLFNEVNFLERFEQAHKAGFSGVEFLFPYQWEKEQLAEKLAQYGLEQVLFNLPAGDWPAGERGIACLPSRSAEFKQGVSVAIEYAKTLNCFQVNCLVGLTPETVPQEEVHRTLVDNLRYAAAALGEEGITLLVEPLNSQDIPGFHLVYTRDALNLIKDISHPNVKLQYDIYHMQVMEGNLTKSIRDNLSLIGHIQFGDNPGRHEPGTGEINFPNLFRFIDEAGYRGWIGCEYKPAGVTKGGLKWLKTYL
jgi:hydroxypyruvate isomerase